MEKSSRPRKIVLINNCAGWAWKCVNLKILKGLLWCPIATPMVKYKLFR